MASLRHRNAAATSVRVGALEAADELRSSHQRANTLFRRVFVTLALVLTGKRECCVVVFCFGCFSLKRGFFVCQAARVLLCFYGLTSPFSLPHHAEAHMTLGPWFALLELVGAFSLLVCAAHFVRSVPKAVSVVLALNVVLALLVAFVPGHEGWLSERGWWFAL